MGSERVSRVGTGSEKRFSWSSINRKGVSSLEIRSIMYQDKNEGDKHGFTVFTQGRIVKEFGQCPAERILRFEKVGVKIRDLQFWTLFTHVNAELF